MVNAGYLERVRAHATKAPDRAALGIVREDGLDVWSYGAVWGAVCAGSARLAEAGIDPGERLAILGETEPAWGVAELAALHRGAIVVPLDPNHPDGVLRAILADSGASGLLASRRQLERARLLLADGTVRAYDDLFDRERDAGHDTPPLSVAADHVRLLVYTSGTTGTPKGVTLTEGNLVSQLDAILAVIPLGEGDALLAILPLNHMYSQIMSLLGPLYLGGTVRFAAEATPQAVRLALERGAITAFGAVPQFFALFRDRILSEVRRRGRSAERAHGALVALSRGVRRVTGWNAGRLLFPAIHRAFGGKLRWVASAGSYLDPALARQYEDWGFPMMAAYGLTEATAAVTVTPPGAVDMATVGRPLPGIAVSIDAPNADGIGEIVVRGPTVMTGYWNRPDATAEVLDAGGRLRTGDLGRFDGRGNLLICGRAKDMIVLASGKNVFPEELDDHYSRHPLIREVCVVGLPESGGGEKLHAVVVPDLDEFRRRGIVTVDDYVRFEIENLALELPGYQRVRAYTIWREPLPRTPTRKVRRFEVRDRVAAELAAGAGTRSSRAPAEEDHVLLDSETMRAIVEGGDLSARAHGAFHPDMSLEFDLGLDSLARAELIAHLGARWEVDPDAMAQALTPREMAAVLERAGRTVGTAGAPAATKVSWSRLLSDPAAAAEAERRLAPRSGARAVSSWIFALGVRAVARGWFRLRVRGAEHLPATERPFVLVANHASFGDPFFVSAALPSRIRRDVFFLGYAGHVDGGLRGLVSRAVRVIPLDAGRRLTRALQFGAAGLRLGHILMIFPEGERTVDGRVREFKPGTALLIRETRAPVVPVAIVGAFESWGRDRKRPKRGTVTVAFGPPIDFGASIGDDEQADLARITAELRNRVADLVRANGGPASAGVA